MLVKGTTVEPQIVITYFEKHSAYQSGKVREPEGSSKSGACGCQVSLVELGKLIRHVFLCLLSSLERALEMNFQPRNQVRWGSGRQKDERNISNLSSYEFHTATLALLKVLAKDRKFLMPDFGGGRKKSFQPYTCCHIFSLIPPGSAMDVYLQRAQFRPVYLGITFPSR